MTPDNRRAHGRVHYEADIQYAPADAGAYLDSRMYNYSRMGMYLEVPQFLAPGGDVLIRMKDYAPDAHGPEAYQSYVANIRWCREIEDLDYPLFGLGVQFLERHHSVLEAPVRSKAVTCDLCGDPTNPVECRVGEDPLRFCAGCHKHLEGLPDGKIKACIHRFLLGNVV